MSLMNVGVQVLLASFAILGPRAISSEARGDDEARAQPFREALTAPVEVKDDRITVSYDFRNTPQTMDFENGKSSSTITVSGGSGSMELGPYQETGRMTFSANDEVRWKAPPLAIDKVTLEVEKAKDIQIDLVAAKGGARISVGPTTRIAVTDPDGETKATKTVKFPLDPSKRYPLEIRVEKGSVILFVEGKRAMKKQLPKDIGDLQGLRLGTASSKIAIAKLSVSGKIPEAAADAPEPDAKPADPDEKPTNSLGGDAPSTP